MNGSWTVPWSECYEDPSTHWWYANWIGNFPQHPCNIGDLWTWTIKILIGYYAATNSWIVDVALWFNDDSEILMEFKNSGSGSAVNCAGLSNYTVPFFAAVACGDSTATCKLSA